MKQQKKCIQNALKKQNPPLKLIKDGKKLL